MIQIGPIKWVIRRLVSQKSVAIGFVGVSLLGYGVYAVVSNYRSQKVDIDVPIARPSADARELEYVPETPRLVQQVPNFTANALQLAQTYNESSSLRQETRSKAKKYMNSTMKRDEKIDELLKAVQEELKNFPPILERKIMPHDDLQPAYHDAKFQFKIMQWNALGKHMVPAEEEPKTKNKQPRPKGVGRSRPRFQVGKPLFNSDQSDQSDSDEGKPRTEAEFSLMRNAYGRYDDWEAFRKWRVLEELIRFKCDILCLQELDFYEDIRPYLEELGYRGIFCPKYSHLLIDNEPEGIAIFYNLDAFQLSQLRCENIYLNGKNEDQVFMIVQLIHRTTRRRITVVNTHLKAFFGHEGKRKTQTEFILETVKRQMADKEQQNDLTARPLVFCGDFNGNEAEEFRKAIYQNSSFQLADAYHRNKRRISDNPQARKLHKRFVDYIFYSKIALHLTKYWALDILSGKKTPMPSLVYPSDHQALVCEFQIGA